MSVLIKRDGVQVFQDVGKFTKFLEQLTFGLNLEYIDVNEIVRVIIDSLSDLSTTVELIHLAAETIAQMVVDHPDHALLAGRIYVTHIHKVTKPTFSKAMQQMYHNKELVSKEFNDAVQKHKNILNAMVIQENDFTFNFFAIKTLEKSYLGKSEGRLLETPQYLFLRTAFSIHGIDFEKTKETYRMLSEKEIMHATPTLLNAGTKHPQYSSCFLLALDEDSISTVFNLLSDCAHISKHMGGLGVSFSRLRGMGSFIRGTGGVSNGLVPVLKMFNEMTRMVDQSGKRPGAMAAYIEPWHPDILMFLDLKKNFGADELRARDLFLGLWIPDLFMRKVKNDEEWALICPSACRQLGYLWGDEFEQLYNSLLTDPSVKKTWIRAQTLWNAIIVAQIETGIPYMLYKDACNRKSNQQNLGTISSSNLCTEIIEYASENEIAVCNLCSVVLSTCFQDDGEFDFDELASRVKVVVNNLEKILDKSFNPLEKTKSSNEKNRPLGIGVQGLADVFMKLKISFESSEAKLLNRQIFETMYYAALTESCALAKLKGPYATYVGSPVSTGILQFDMWNVTPCFDKWDWDVLRANIKRYGVRHSLLLAPMPTASTAQITGNTESFEPITSNMYTRKVLSGDFQLVNRYLIEDLIKMGMWNENVKNRLIAARGSVQEFPEFTDEFKALYKTVWEIPTKTIIDMAVDRGAFIDQSQSMNIYMKEPTVNKVSNAHFYGWSKGLKTGMYYLRTHPATDPIQFTVDKSKLTAASVPQICTDDVCFACQ